MSKFFRFDPVKALNVILKVAKGLPYPGFFQISKIIYFADKMHLQRYGRQICGDDYAAMENGPVPDEIYKLMKAAKGTGSYPYSELVKDAFTVEEEHVVVPLRDWDHDLFSESDIECLNESVKKFGRKGFDELKRISHDKAWEEVWEEMKNGYRGSNIIDIATIIKTLDGGEELLDYLETSIPHASVK